MGMGVLGFRPGRGGVGPKYMGGSPGRGVIGEMGRPGGQMLGRPFIR